MNLEYTTKSGEVKSIQNVSIYKIIKTQAKSKPQFAPIALPPKPGGSGGQNEYMWIEGDDMELLKELNVNQAVRKWLWGHRQSGWIYWVDKQDAKRIDKENKGKPGKLKEKDWNAAKILNWPVIAILNNYIYISEIVNTKKGPYGKVVGIPADAKLSTELLFTHPGWVHTANNTKGSPIYKDGELSFMPIFAREGRRNKAKGSLWIHLDFCELVTTE